MLIETRTLELASKLYVLHHLSLLYTPKIVNKLGCLYVEVKYLKEAVDIYDALPSSLTDSNVSLK